MSALRANTRRSAAKRRDLMTAPMTAPRALRRAVLRRHPTSAQQVVLAEGQEEGILSARGAIQAAPRHPAAAARADGSSESHAPVLNILCEGRKGGNLMFHPFYFLVGKGKDALAEAASV
jgi:hypothetical protein